MTDRARTVEERLAETFARERRDGLRLALTGRLVVVVIFGLWVAVSRPAPLVYHTLAAVGAFALLGAVQLRLIGSRWDRQWIPYAFALADVIFLTVITVGFSAATIADLPPPIAYRFATFLFFFLFVAAAAFSYTPGLVLWTGVAGSIVWGAGFGWVLTNTDWVSFDDVPPSPTQAEFFAVFFNPNFVGTANRIQEMLVLTSVAALLAIVVARARRVVHRHALAEQERELVAESFGRYVPEAVARAIIADRGVLAPEQRTATVLFADIERFTSIAETMRPADVVAMLNAYFDAVAEVIGRHGGVINQFQGDAILATFNVPVAAPDHAAAAVRTALAVQRTLADREFQGRALVARIGINTGEMVAGAVGSRGRQSYTVHGDAVNLAARLETMNKDYGTRVLVSASTVAQAGPGFSFRDVDRVAGRGRSETLTVYTIDPLPPDADERAVDEP